MQSLTLLERLTELENLSQKKGGEDFTKKSPLQKLEASVIRHLNAILNTRKGSVPIAPDFGIADITDLGRSFTDESLEDFKSELERVILLYEPRLSGISIKHSPKANSPLFVVFLIEATISATIEGREGQHLLQFETLFDASNVAYLSKGA